MIEVRNLTKRYGSATAVEGLTFSVRPGVVTGFLGPNGAGKSTTMRMIVGLDRPTEGEATIGGTRYHDLKDPLRTVGCLLDASWTHAKRSGRAHLSMQAAAAGIGRARVDEMLDLVGLTSVASRKVGGYSLGMRQRLGLATAMLGDPEVLLFDEPVNGLDPEGIVWIRNFMKDRAREGRTVLVSSHLLSEMAQTAEDLIVIGRGKVRAQTSVEDFIATAESTVVFKTPMAAEFDQAVRDQGLAAGFDERTGSFHIEGASAAEVGELAARHGVTVHELFEKRASLEEVFMALTNPDVEYHGATGVGGRGLPVSGPGPQGPYAPRSGYDEATGFEHPAPGERTGSDPVVSRQQPRPVADPESYTDEDFRPGGGPPPHGYLPDYSDDQKGGRR